MSDRWTIRRVLEWTARDFADKGIESARLDAELLVSRALGIERVGLYLDLDRPLQPPELAEIRKLVQRRRRREPVAYILGYRDFFARRFEVTPAVLVPRPDTETLVERALAHLPSEVPTRALDLCTGSGIVAVSLAAERTQLQVDATELSAEALEVARRNADRHGVGERVELFEGDLFEAVPADRRYRVVTANPPYVASAQFDGLQPEVRDWEPRMALDGGDEGFDIQRRIVTGATAVLEPGGSLLVEVGAEQAAAVAERMRESGFTGVSTHPDLAGIERVVEGKVD